MQTTSQKKIKFVPSSFQSHPLWPRTENINSILLITVHSDLNYLVMVLFSIRNFDLPRERAKI